MLINLHSNISSVKLTMCKINEKNTTYIHQNILTYVIVFASMNISFYKNKKSTKRTLTSSIVHT